MEESNIDTIGPHEGRELALMMAGTKPLSMFVEEVPAQSEYFPEDQFDALVAQGKLKKFVSIETSPVPNGVDRNIRRVLYSLPDQEWRINAILSVLAMYKSLGGFRPDLERMTGDLLGYAHGDVERFIEAFGSAHR